MLTRRLDELDLLVIYVDGLIFADHVVLAAVGVDRRGNKHVLGLQHAATESTAAAEDLPVAKKAASIAAAMANPAVT